MNRWLFCLASGVLGLAASCAATTESAGDPDPVRVTVPDASGDAGSDAPRDGALENACDASDPNCVTKPVSCAEAAWCPSPTGVSILYALTSVWGSGPNDVWAAGSGGTVVHWDGAAWKPVPVPVKNTIHAVTGTGPNDVWVVSATDTIFHSVGFGGGSASWVRAPSPLDEFSIVPLYAAWSGAGGELRLGGQVYNLFEENGDFGPGNQFEKTVVDGAVGWKGVKGTATVNAIWGASADDLWIAGDNSAAVSWQLGLTMHGTRPAGSNEALAWVEVDSQASVILSAIWGSSAADVWAVGDKGTIRRIEAGAPRWEIALSPTAEPLHAIWGASGADVWAVGENGTILHFDGTAWKASLAAFPVHKKKPDLYGVWGSGPNDVWIVGDGIALHHTGGNK